MTYEIPAIVNPPADRHLAVTLAGTALDRFALGVCLLKEQLVSSVLLRDGATRCEIQLSRDARLAPHEVSRIRNDGRRSKVAVSSTQLEALVTFFLKAVRDGLADVNHLDIEDQASGSEFSGWTLVVKVDRAKPPLSEEELRWRLSKP